MSHISKTLVEWKSPIFCPTLSCFCVKSCICPCWAYANIMEQKFGDSCVESCLKFLCCMPCCCGTYYHQQARSQIRHDYRLKESCASDSLVTSFCAPCALCQEKDEINSRGATLANAGPSSQNMQ